MKAVQLNFDPLPIEKAVLLLDTTFGNDDRVPDRIPSIPYLETRLNFVQCNTDGRHFAALIYGRYSAANRIDGSLNH